MPGLRGWGGRREPTHPQFTKALRWWIAVLPVYRMLAAGLGVLLAYALVGAGLGIVAEQSPVGLADRFSDGRADFTAVAEMFRATLGDPFRAQPGNLAQQTLASVTSVVGVLVPALVIGVVFIRLFAVSPFVWRERVSVCKASECDFQRYADAHLDSDDAMMTVRFYNRFTNLAIADMSCRVYLHYIGRSPDTSGVFHKEALKQLDGKGELAAERLWPSAEQGAPFTLWIPLGVPLDELPVKRIQGVDVQHVGEVKLLIRVSGKSVGLGTEIVDEKWYRLGAEDRAVDLGRYAPVDAVPGVNVKDWDGWSRFERVETAAAEPSALEGTAAESGMTTDP